MARPLIDLLWRDHPSAPRKGARGPQSRVTTGDVVEAAVDLADSGGLVAVTVRHLADRLGISTMSVYTHVNSRDDLLVLMADQAYTRMRLPDFGRAGWRTRVKRVAEAELALYRDHPWLVDVTDQRTALGPGTIARYDHELHAFDSTGLDDRIRDAALTFVLDFVRAAARAERDPVPEELSQQWEILGPRLATYVGDDFPLAVRIGAAAGEELQAAYRPDYAWQFGLDRVLDGLAALIT